jgi:hypothetical protein
MIDPRCGLIPEVRGCRDALHIAQPVIGDRQLLEQDGVVWRVECERIELLGRPLQEQAPRRRRSRQRFDCVMQLEEQRVGHAPCVLEPLFRQCSLAFCPPGLPERRRQTGHERNDQQHTCGDGYSVSHHEFPCPVPPRVGPREHRQPAQKPPDVFCQLLDRRVPPIRLLRARTYDMLFCCVRRRGGHVPTSSRRGRSSTRSRALRTRVATSGARATRVGKVRKAFWLDPRLLDEARASLGASSEREAVEMALDLVSFRKELAQGARALRGLRLSRID